MNGRKRVWADIDLDAISHNLGVIRSRIREGGKIMLVSKADAYGHGVIPIARHVLSRNEVAAFGVGDSEEALELREAGIDAPILILGAIVEDEDELVVANDIAICAHSMSRIRQLEREARRQGRKCRIHIMVDTGMGRLGPFADKALELAQVVVDSEWLTLEGVATHFSSSQNVDDPFTQLQARRFDEFRDRLIASGVPVPVFHAANSGAVLFEDGATHDLVRVGAAAYGMIDRKKPGAETLRPALALRTQIIYLKDVPPGTPISYNRMYTTPKKTRIATLPIGYNDGLRYALSNRWSVLVNGQKAPIVGAISMDYCMVDVGHLPNVRAGDVCTLIGRDGDQELTVTDWADALKTVPYEVTTGLGRRVKRIHRPERCRPSLAVRSTRTSTTPPRTDQERAAEVS